MSKSAAELFRLLAKAILVPSGDQLGSPSTARPLVTWSVPPPVRVTVQMSSPRWKAILVPSREKAGFWSTAVPVVRWVSWVPSGFTV
jgi:hypothetical protein